MNKKLSLISGFTLIELMVTIVIIAILLTVAIPSFREMIGNNRISVNTNQFVDIVQFARSEAVKRGVSVLIESRDSSVSTNEWGKGGIAVGVDSSGDGDLTGAEIIRVVDAFNANVELNTDGVDQFVFLPNGFTNLVGVQTLSLCDDRTGETGREFKILVSGLIRSYTLTCP